MHAVYFFLIPLPFDRAEANILIAFLFAWFFVVDTVRISQPPFLIMLCCGCIVSCLSIIPMGVQTEHRYIKDTVSTGALTDEVNPDINAVDAACMM